MYLNLQKEMIRNGIKWRNIWQHLKKDRLTIHNKFIKCTSKVYLDEAFMIRDEFFPDLTIEYLFKIE